MTELLEHAFQMVLKNLDKFTDGELNQLSNAISARLITSGMPLDFNYSLNSEDSEYLHGYSLLGDFNDKTD